MEMKKKKPKKVESNKENYIDDIFFAKFILFTFPSFCFLLHIIFSFHFYFFHFTPYGLKLVIFFFLPFTFIIYNCRRVLKQTRNESLVSGGRG